MPSFCSQLEKESCLFKPCFSDDWSNRIAVHRNDLCLDTTTKQKEKQWLSGWLNSVNVWTCRSSSLIMATLMPLFSLLFMPTGSHSSASSLHNFVTVMEIVELEHAGYVKDTCQPYRWSLFTTFWFNVWKNKMLVLKQKAT